MKKITFLTGHNWNSNRLGAFYKFVEVACNLGIEVVFFSFPRPYYAYFMHQELFNKGSIKALQKGISYEVGKSTLKNISSSTFKLPNFANKFLTDRMMNTQERLSFSSFKSFAKKWFSETAVFVFESSDGMIFVDKIKKMFPNANIIYRPRDTLMYDDTLSRYVKNELNMMKKADLNIIVNKEGLDLYKRKILDFDNEIKYTLLSNGVDIESYEKSYACSNMLKKENTVLYVGAWEVEWELLFKAAKENPEFNYIVVCPNYPSNEIQKKVSETKNLFYVPEIFPEKVTSWITNCSVVMVPYVTSFHKSRPLRITAKYYQAMAAHNPTVSYCDTPKLKDALSERKWSTIKSSFLDMIGELS